MAGGVARADAAAGRGGAGRGMGRAVARVRDRSGPRRLAGRLVGPTRGRRPLTARAAPAPDTLRQNLLALYLLQAANYGIPLLVLPFLVRAVGVERFGLIAFAQTVVQYFVFAVDAGFNNNATREIAVRRGRGTDPVLEIYWATRRSARACCCSRPPPSRCCWFGCRRCGPTGSSTCCPTRPCRARSCS